MIVTLWAAMIVGMALWGYGLLVTGHRPTHRLEVERTVVDR